MKRDPAMVKRASLQISVILPLYTSISTISIIQRNMQWKTTQHKICNTLQAAATFCEAINMFCVYIAAHKEGLCLLYIQNRNFPNEK